MFTCYILETIIFLTEFIFMFTYNGVERILIEGQPHGKLIYTLRFLVIPVFLTYLEIVIFTFVNRSKKFSEKTKNFCVILAVLFIAGISMISHTVYPSMICAVSIPILLSTIYGDKKITKIIGCIGAVFVVASFLISFFEIRSFEQENVINDYIIGFLLIVCSYISSITLIDYQKKKNRDIIDGYIKQQELQELLKLDPLTHLYNHNAVYEILEGIIRNPGDKKTIVVMMDIDDFKAVNDVYGHTNGDIVLEVLSVLIRNNVGDKGYPARYGGEEFAVVFSGVELDDAEKIMNNILYQFSHYDWHFEKGMSITFSAGVVCIDNYDISGKDCFGLADKALYEAKKSGRNRVIVSKQA